MNNKGLKHQYFVSISGTRSMHNFVGSSTGVKLPDTYNRYANSFA